jgi:hypothetical protein
VKVQGRSWWWFAWLLLAAGVVGVVFAAAAPAQSYGTPYYPTPTAYANGNYLNVALYGAGFIPAADPPAPGTQAAGQAPGTDNAELLRQLIQEQRETQKLLRRLLELTESEGEAPAAGAGAKAGADAEPDLIDRRLSQEEAGAVTRKLRANKMPPLESRFRLTADERSNMIAYFTGGKADTELLARSFGQCIACHAATADYRKAGGGFVLFEKRETTSSRR